MIRSRTRSFLLTVVVAGASLDAAGALADKPANPPADKAGSPPGHPMYDAATVETLHGEVVEVKRVVPRAPMMAKRFGHGVHMILKTEKETIEVHLGPAAYVEQQDVKLAATDRVEVKGSRVTVDGKAVILAEFVREGDKVLTLREPDGSPKWRGRFGPGGPPAR